MVLFRILKPVVDSQFENQRLGRGIVFFLLPFVFIVGLYLVMGIRIDLAGLAIAIVKELAFWVVATLVLFVLLAAFKGKEVHGKFKSIMAAFSSIYLLTFLASLFSFALAFLFVPGFFQKIVSLQAKNPTFAEIVSSISAMALPSQNILIVLFVLLFGIGAATFLLGLYTIYHIGSLVRKTSAFSNSVFVIVFVGLAFLIVSGISLIFSFL